MNERDNNPTERERPPQLRPQVWIACLAAYNNGRLHGEWVDAAVSDEELIARAQQILASSPEPGAEEWAIFDYEDFGAFQVGEYEQLETVARVARGITEHGPAFAAWAELHDADPTMLDQFEDAFLGEYDSPEDWARHVMSDLDLEQSLDSADIPESLRPYLRIDYDGWARDAQLAGEIHIEDSPDGRIYVFAIR